MHEQPSPLPFLHTPAVLALKIRLNRPVQDVCVLLMRVTSSPLCCSFLERGQATAGKTRSFKDNAVYFNNYDSRLFKSGSK
jgi:hypothetical protein